MADEPLVAGLDVGSTNAKAGIFALDGRRIAVVSRPMPLRRAPDGSASFDPNQVWGLVCDALREVAVEAADSGQICALGVTSMAESGLLLDAATGSPLSQLIPWFDTGAAAEAARLAEETDQLERFRVTGLRMSYKAGAAKALTVAKQRGRTVLEGARWLSTADFVAFRLTGAMRTDPTLAARTQAFSLDAGDWDGAWLDRESLSAKLFAPVVPSGEIVGRIGDAAASDCGLLSGLPVAIAGHDHVVAALAAGAFDGGRALDSMGTAESLTGGMPRRVLSEADYQSGLTFGPQLSCNGMHWMGALPASGGSIEWLRTMLADPYVSYEHLLALLNRAGPGPCPILYFPYLAGAQAPQPDPGARGAFVGLTAAHNASDLALAVIQGAAYEMERVRQAAEGMAGPIDEVIVAGGGVRIRRWLQIKADVAGHPLVVSPHAEAALLGAALLAGAGAGMYDSLDRAVAGVNARRGSVVEPDLVDHRAHRRLLDGPFRALQAPLREASAALAHALREHEALA